MLAHYYINGRSVKREELSSYEIDDPIIDKTVAAILARMRKEAAGFNEANDTI